MRLRLPRPGRAYHSEVRGTHIWMAASSKAQAKRLSVSLYRDMLRSEKLRMSVTMDNGHVGVGHAGVARAKKGFRNV